jgi:hypothetical protein
VGDLGVKEVWHSSNFTPAFEPRHRSWPYPKDRLERLAFTLGMDDRICGSYCGTRSSAGEQLANRLGVQTRGTKCRSAAWLSDFP